MQIPFNKPYLTGKEITYIQEAAAIGKLSGDGVFTKKCERFFEEKYGFKKSMLTSSCTDALEMAAILINIQEGDEVIMPSFTFVSTANAFIMRGAKIVFADSSAEHPNIDATKIANLITRNTKAIVVVHYAGVACDMESIMALANQYNLFVIEDAAQAIDAYYKGKPLGSIGHLAAFSFHETKNIIAGEGGMLIINDEKFIERAEIIREKGTNRNKFYRGEIDKYNWVDIGSSFLPSEITAAFLWAQIEAIDDIQQKRISIWNTYYEALLAYADFFQLPVIHEYASNNAHAFYLVCQQAEDRNQLIDFFRSKNILAVFHYQSLHKSPYFIDKHDARILQEADRYSQCLLRLPLFYELSTEEITHTIIPTITTFVEQYAY
ncbi:MAG TPA: dTDP-4-amino-4,6-dideoxygalactose transaminase [Chitinophagales bacterium]|nr:dTDP-4-amino-4,6-dideoxygalactose transaminase [Chitinophagales bacterium]HNB49079.1 dTDP-4-amino-4,6-dideoxygalactose transaminase [Chitinophagales bacterium]HNC72142.1 dTDP-4-amino-4,6-dideoxygalactose transaminase [Chitinophagales bacterium]HND83171.1 dTDP-4-amino-4,6-dideoxygalactose transaminase [Chitinophagales bacterium]HNF20063.1 dTDP-4-amino-4,6-dideoxygalactose transaminase [Chitinophagales bacterium]